MGTDVIIALLGMVTLLSFMVGLFLIDYNKGIITELIDFEYRASKVTSKRDLKRYLKLLDEKPILIRTRSINREIEIIADDIRKRIKECE